MRIVATIGILILSCVAFSQGKSDLSNHAFEGKIIRSFSVNPEHPNQILVGLKGSDAGTGVVFLSKDAGMNWEPLNKGKALCDSCEDVQAVCFITDEIYLAGTWKNGLYLSTNAGKKFVKVKDFPANDIRSIIKSPAGIIYAATTTHGIMKTEDEGKSWQAPHLQEMNKTLASWKLYLAPTTNKILYACTFQNGLYKTTNGGVSWKQVLYEKDVMIWDIEMINNEIYAVGSSEESNYLFHSYLGEKKWEKHELNMYGNVNSMHIMKVYKDYKILLGSWGNGVQYTYAIEPSKDGYRCVEFVKDDSIGVQDIYSNENFIYNFSWGDGVKIYTREKECNVDIPADLSLPSLGHTQNAAITASCPLDYCNFKLYNRWGELQYQSTAGLDSVNLFFETGSSDLQSGTYVYWMKSSFTDDADTVSLKGHMEISK